jgi:D-methionine transport system ATP-binding protein
MIFQDVSLFQQRSVLGNVTFPLELRRDKKEHREKRARELLNIVGLADKEASYPSQLSGGQQQRVAIARALANNPKIMLCDEATSALDTCTTAAILSLLKSINKELGVTMIVITHSLSVASKVCDKIAVIDEGKIVECGATEKVFAFPESPVTKELLRNDNLTSVYARGEPRLEQAQELEQQQVLEQQLEQQTEQQKQVLSQQQEQVQKKAQEQRQEGI